MGGRAGSGGNSIGRGNRGSQETDRLADLVVTRFNYGQLNVYAQLVQGGMDKGYAARLVSDWGLSKKPLSYMQKEMENVLKNKDSVNSSLNTKTNRQELTESLKGKRQELFEFLKDLRQKTGDASYKPKPIRRVLTEKKASLEKAIENAPKEFKSVDYANTRIKLAKEELAKVTNILQIIK